MRWLLALLFLALVVGGAYAGGRYMLPNDLEVSGGVEVARPRAAVFAMVNDLNIAKEWSSYYARDPAAEFRIDGPPGPGQMMQWSSRAAEVGVGAMHIQSTTPQQEVYSIIRILDRQPDGEQGTRDRRAELESRIRLQPTQQGTQVRWVVSAGCPDGWQNVPCRYMNLLLARQIQGQIDAGLARLKNLAEQLPPHDFEGYDIEQTPVPSSDVIFVDVTFTVPPTGPSYRDRAEAERQGVEMLNSAVAAAGLTPDRTRLVRMFPQEGEAGRYSFSLGYPISGPAPLLVGTRVGQTPAGLALRAVHVGPRSEVPRMYQIVDAYLQAHRLSLREGGAWEVATPEPQPEGASPDDPIERTEIYYPLEVDAED